MNLGYSPEHHSTIPHVLNPSTGVITTPYHVVFDEWFATVDCDEDKLPDLTSPEWANLFGYAEVEPPDEALNQPLPVNTTSDCDMQRMLEWRECVASAMDGEPVESVPTQTVHASVADVQGLVQPPASPRLVQRESSSTNSQATVPPTATGWRESPASSQRESPASSLREPPASSWREPTDTVMLNPNPSNPRDRPNAHSLPPAAPKNTPNSEPDVTVDPLQDYEPEEQPAPVEVEDGYDSDDSMPALAHHPIKVDDSSDSEDEAEPEPPIAHKHNRNIPSPLKSKKWIPRNSK